MTHTTTKKEQSQVELTITVTPEDYAPMLEAAAKTLSERVAVKGFRKGNIPMDILVREVGEMAILQEALDAIVQKFYYQAVTEEKLDTIGQPQIGIDKLAPGNDVVFKATVALLPEVKLADVSKITIERKEKPVDDTRVNETIDALRGMNATEVVKDGPASEDKDKLMIDMTMTIDGVVVEGGKSTDYQVYLSEDHYIPGFNKELVGLKKGDTKKFTLSFPKTHYQKHLAGKKVDFEVVVKDVFERQLPELNDEFAKGLNMESVDALKEAIKSNLEAEATQKADQTFNVELLDAVIEKSTFADIPQILIDAERQKMFYELKSDLDKHGVTIEQYLQDIKKKEDELMEGFREQAEKRAKAALVSRQVALEHEIAISDEELDKEIEQLKETYKHSMEAQENLKRADVRASIASGMQNRKVMEWLRENVKTKEAKSK